MQQAPIKNATTPPSVLRCRRALLLIGIFPSHQPSLVPDGPRSHCALDAGAVAHQRLAARPRAQPPNRVVGVCGLGDSSVLARVTHHFTPFWPPTAKLVGRHSNVHMAHTLSLAPTLQVVGAADELFDSSWLGRIAIWQRSTQTGRWLSTCSLTLGLILYPHSTAHARHLRESGGLTAVLA